MRKVLDTQFERLRRYWVLLLSSRKCFSFYSKQIYVVDYITCVKYRRKNSEKNVCIFRKVPQNLHFHNCNQIFWGIKEFMGDCRLQTVKTR